MEKRSNEKLIKGVEEGKEMGRAKGGKEGEGEKREVRMFC